MRGAMKIQHLGYALLLTLPLAACKGKGEAPAEETETAAAAAPAAKGSAPAGNYPAKSGIIEWKTDMMGEMTTVVYFDDNGAKQASYTTTRISLFGTNTVTHSVEINADGWTIKYDPDAKTGSRYRSIGGAVGGMPTFPEAKELSRMKSGEGAVGSLEELPPRTILGKEAKGFAITAMGMKVRGWIWENIPLRTETDMGGKEPMVTEATRLELGVPVPADKFAVPADVVITEDTM